VNYFLEPTLHALKVFLTS